MNIFVEKNRIVAYGTKVITYFCRTQYFKETVNICNFTQSKIFFRGITYLQRRDLPFAFRLKKYYLMFFFSFEMSRIVTYGRNVEPHFFSLILTKNRHSIFLETFYLLFWKEFHSNPFKRNLTTNICIEQIIFKALMFVMSFILQAYNILEDEPQLFNIFYEKILFIFLFYL